jgi:hypothetical protein
MSEIKRMNLDEFKQLRISDESLLPLELTHRDLHICLWSEEETFKWTIGYFELSGDGPRFKFVGERPLDARVDWVKFKQLIKLGYALAWHKFDCEQDKKSV